MQAVLQKLKPQTEAPADKFNMIRQIQNFCNDIIENIMGYSSTLSTDNLTYGAQINVQLQTEVKNIITKDNLEEISQNHFKKHLMLEYINKVTEAIQLIKCSLKKAVYYSSNTYPLIKKQILHHTHIWIEKEGEHTISRLIDHIKCEISFINIAHLDSDSEILTVIIKKLQKTVLDVTRKYIAYFFIKKVLDTIKNDLMLNILASLKEQEM